MNLKLKDGGKCRAVLVLLEWISVPPDLGVGREVIGGRVPL
jgi:hypothetical protein